MLNDLIFSRIKKMLEGKKIPLKEFCTEIGITDSGFRKMQKNDSIKVSTLHEIAEYFNVTIDYFLNENQTKVKELTSEKEAGYQKVIAELKAKVEILIREVEELKSKSELQKLKDENTYLREITGLQKKNINLEEEVKRLTAEIAAQNTTTAAPKNTKTTHNGKENFL